MSKSNICVAIVRHGDYVGGGGDFQDPLSEYGKKQMQNVREVIDGHLVRIYGKNVQGEVNVQRLAISFSSTTRALESILAMKLHEDMIVTELYFAERYQIREPEKNVRKVLDLLAYYGAKVATIVAHGDMPAVFAETLIKIAVGEERSLRSPAKGHGFLVNMATGEVLMLSPAPEKLKDEVTAARQPVPQVSQSRVFPVRSDLPGEHDDGIPF